MKPGALGTRFFGTLAILGAATLLIGLLLPGTWTAERTDRLDAAPDDVYRLIDAPEGWRAWTPWPDSGLVASGPARGAGAAITWDDPELGDGSFRIVEALPRELVRYEVAVQGGRMRTEGTLRLSPESGGTRVTWTEHGDFGRNPLMGWWALFMERAQGAQMAQSLERLGEAATSAAAAPSR